jgi:hypothetical protein
MRQGLPVAGSAKRVVDVRAQKPGRKAIEHKFLLSIVDIESNIFIEIILRPGASPRTIAGKSQVPCSRLNSLAVALILPDRSF